MDCVKEWLCNNYLLVVGIIGIAVLIIVVASFFINRWKKWMFNNYLFLLFLIFLIVIDAAYLASRSGVEWEYMIPVVIALASLIYPLLNDVKRRKDNEQNAFDFIYYSLFSLSMRLENIKNSIDSNMKITKDENVKYIVEPGLNANFTNYVDHVALNQFFKEENLLAEWRIILSYLGKIDVIADFYREVFANYSNNVAPQNQILYNYPKLLSNTRVDVLNDGKLNESFKMEYIAWADRVSSENLQGLKMRSQDFERLIAITNKFINDGDGYTKMRANSINEEVNILRAADYRNYQEMEKLKHSLRSIDLKTPQEKFKNFQQENIKLISKELKKQLDEMEKAQTSK